MRNLFIIGIMCFYLGGYAQNTKIIDAWKDGKYEKCLTLAEKAVKKNPKNYEAVFYKALALSQLANVKEYEKEHAGSAEKSVRILLSMQKKDKDGKIFPEYADIIDQIKKNYHDKAISYMVSGKQTKTIDLYDNMLLLFPDNEIYYRKGICLRDMQDLDGAIENLNIAAKNIYKDFKKGKIQKPYLLDAFMALASIFDEKNQQGNAISVLTKAAFLFPENDTIKNKYFDILNDEIQNVKWYQEESKITKAINIMGAGSRLFPGDPRFSGLYWKASEDYLLYFWELPDAAQFKKLAVGKAFGDTLSDAETSYNKVSDFLLEQIQSKMPENKEQKEKSAADIKILSDVFLSIYAKKNNIKSNELAAVNYIKWLKDKNEKIENMSFAFLCLFPTNKEIKNIQFAANLKLVTLTKKAEEMRGQWKKLKKLLLLFPDDKKVTEALCNLTISIAENEIDAEKYSQVPDILYYGRTEFPDDKRILSLKRKWMENDYKDNYLTSDVAAFELGWTGSTDQCLEGVISETAMQRCLQRLIYLRRLAGVPDSCVFRDDWNKKCQKAALIMSANDMLTHQPNDKMKCFTVEGQEAAGHSNLSLGDHSTGSLDGFVEDGGSNNYAVGHRRWVLYPARKVYGIGSTSNAEALWTLGGEKSDFSDTIYSQYKNRFVSWPPADFVKASLVFGRWSFSLMSSDLSQAKVIMTCNWKPVSIKMEQYYSGYGMPTVVWIPDISYSIKAETTYKISISNVKTETNETKVFNYFVTIIP
jgi:tetratricopeptide (TPR) repeat protein